MKTLLAVLLLFAAGLAVGATSRELAVTKLPWLSDAMKAPCGKTTLEYNLAAGSVNPEPFQICAEFDAMRFVGTPVDRGLVVRCDVRPRPGITFSPADKKYTQYAGSGLYWTCDWARRRFCPGDKTVFANDLHLYALLYFNGKLVGVRTAEFVLILPPNYSEDTAVKELLKH